MNIASIGNLSDLGKYAADSVATAKENNNASFEELFKAAKNMISDTNNYTNAAEEAETAFALGTNTNTYELQEAQQKANLSLQYTISVRNAALDAYRDIMNLQF